MSEYDKREIFLSQCGCTCPSDTPCAYRGEDGECLLEEPWYDCATFMDEYANEIAAAEEDMEEEEEED